MKPAVKPLKPTVKEQNFIRLLRRLPAIDQRALANQAREWVTLHQRYAPKEAVR
jgi:hypothetical protein